MLKQSNVREWKKKFKLKTSNWMMRMKFFFQFYISYFSFNVIQLRHRHYARSIKAFRIMILYGSHWWWGSFRGEIENWIRIKNEKWKWSPPQFVMKCLFSHHWKETSTFALGRIENFFPTLTTSLHASATSWSWTWSYRRELIILKKNVFVVRLSIDPVILSINEHRGTCNKSDNFVSIWFNWKVAYLHALI